MYRTLFASLFISISLIAQGQKGYYRFPTIHNETVIFTSEGDLWKFDLTSRVSQRLTTHLGMESHPDISPDGQWVAYSAQYDGPQEIYLMPIDGGLPQRITYEGETANVIGWTPDNRIIYSTRHYSTLPNTQLVLVDPISLDRTVVSLAQASDGAYSVDMSNLYFVRLPFQGSQTKRYQGGMAQNIWLFNSKEEAKALTAFYPGTTKNPMMGDSQLFFLSDNDGTMNLYSMPLSSATGWYQHTKSAGWDLKEPDIHGDNIVYQKGADIYLYNHRLNSEVKLDISLASDFDQQRLRWITEPFKEISNIEISQDGERIIVTSRGRIFSIPVKGGRVVEVNKQYGVRHRQGMELPQTDDIVFLSDQSGEVEIWSSDGYGMGVPQQITTSSKALIMDMLTSSNGKEIAFWDKDQNLKVVRSESGETVTIDYSPHSEYYNMSWSPDSDWLAYTKSGENSNIQIHLFNVEGKAKKVLTTNRLDSYSPMWSSDSKWLYLLSDRDFQTLVRSPWGQRQPEPFYDGTTRIYALDLIGDGEFPFRKATELDGQESIDVENNKPRRRRLIYEDQANHLNLNGLEKRIYPLPLAGGNRSDLSANSDYLFWIETESSPEHQKNLYCYKISNDVDNKPVELADDIVDYRLSGNGKKLLIRDKKSLFIVDADSKKLERREDKIDLEGWKFQIDPKDEWRQMFVDSWRLMRDYFYDKKMHGLDWTVERDRHLPLVDRINDRQELDDLISHMVGELSTLHTFVRSRDVRKPEVEIDVGSLGVLLEKTLQDGGYTVSHIYQSDPDYPEEMSPLAQTHLKVKVGEIITAIDGTSVLSVKHPGELLLDKSKKEVRLSLKSKDGKIFDEIVVPMTADEEKGLRYSDWELSRRNIVEERSNAKIGYFHLRAMSGPNFIEFVKGYYPVFHKQGLIIDARNNRGGNVDSWVLEKLMRKAWMYWQRREGEPYWNMQYAFRGHMVVIVNERTSSDGEAFAEGFRRLEFGDVIGTRTWGGEVWLSGSNRLVDNGIASAAESGVYGPEGKWLIEGWGLEPDQVVDNLPYATFRGEDRQLDAAIEHLLEKIEQDPVKVPPHPPYLDKSFDYKRN